MQGKSPLLLFPDPKDFSLQDPNEARLLSSGMSVLYSGYEFLSVFQKAPARIPEPCLPLHSQFCYRQNLPSVLLSIPSRFRPISENGHLPSTDLLPEWTDRKYSVCFRYTRFSTDLLSCGWKSIFLFPGQTRLSYVRFPKK